jgi:hypothetical protein
MTGYSTTTVVVTVNVSPTVEERVVDWLLDSDQAFTSAPVYGHGADQRGLSVAEQVSGRQKRVEFRIELDAASLDGFLERLASRFARTDLYFWVTPVLLSGHLRQDVETSST